MICIFTFSLERKSKQKVQDGPAQSERRADKALSFFNSLS